MKYIKLFEEYNSPLTLIRGEGKNNSGNVDLFGKGLYLTDDLGVAKFYGDTIREYVIEGKIYDTTKPFTSSEFRKILFNIDNILKTNICSKYLQEVIDYNDGKLPKDTDIDYIRLSWALDSRSEFYDVLKKNDLIYNNFNSYANVCSVINMALNKMGYVGLKYSTTEIEDLEDVGLGDKNSYVIFDKNSIKTK
jgi:hypothetical protein